MRIVLGEKTPRDMIFTEFCTIICNQKSGKLVVIVNFILHIFFTEMLKETPEMHPYFGISFLLLSISRRRGYR